MMKKSKRPSTGDGKKKKKKKAKKTDEFKPPIYDIPKYQDPKEVTPKVDLTVILADPQTPLFNLNMRLPITTPLDYVAQQIKKMHLGAVSDITIAVKDGEPLSFEKTLEEIDMFSEGKLTLYYDYKPVCYPLLF